MQVLLAQVAVPLTRSADERRAHVERLAERLSDALGKEQGHVGLVLLPELVTVEYSSEAFERLSVLAEEAEGDSFQSFAKLARAHGTHVCFGFPRKAEGGYFISQAVAGPEGELVACYDKQRLSTLAGSVEKEFFMPGSSACVFECGGFRWGMLICYDFRFGPLLGELISQGAHAILHPAAFQEDATFYSWHSFAVARALEAQAYFLSVNRAGPGMGRSIACPPWVDASRGASVLGTGEEFRNFRVERAELKRVRREYPLLKDRQTGG
jgi:nitrilase